MLVSCSTLTHVWHHQIHIKHEVLVTHVSLEAQKVKNLVLTLVGLISVLCLHILHVSVTKRLIICHLVWLVVNDDLYILSGVAKYWFWPCGVSGIELEKWGLFGIGDVKLTHVQWLCYSDFGYQLSLFSTCVVINNTLSKDFFYSMLFCGSGVSSLHEMLL